MVTSVSPLRAAALVAALVLGIGSTASAQERTVYADGFGDGSTFVETGVGVSWSDARVDQTPSGRRFRGRFGNDALVLRLTNLPPHTAVTVSFSLYLINSWDGNGTSCCPEEWELYTQRPSDGRQIRRLLYATFSNVDINPYQTYPSPIADTYVNNPRYGGAAAVNTLGYGGYGDSTYRIARSVRDADGTVDFVFAGYKLQDLADESWGLDDLVVSIVPKATDIRAWGDNRSGQLGDGGTSASATPVSPGLTGVKAIAQGGYHSVAVVEDGTVHAWGSNGYGQLGNGSFTDAASPQPVPDLTGVIEIAAGGSHSVALKRDGTVWTWGQNAFGQLGQGTSGAPSAVPSQVSGLSDIVDIAAGEIHTLALGADGTVWAWGYGLQGGLGDGSATSTSVPVQSLISDVVEIAAGDYHSLALGRYGQVWVWGSNSARQLGLGDEVNRALPTRLMGIGEVTALAGGNLHSLALRADGSIWAWGWNGSGQLGGGGTATAYTPTTVSRPAGVAWSAVAGGGYGSAAVSRDGRVWQWGRFAGTQSYTPQIVRGASGGTEIDAEGANVLLLAGGPWPILSVSARTHDFGTVKTGLTSTSTVTITNTGSAPLVLGSTAVTGSHAAAFRFGSECAADIAPGASCDASLTFSPTRGGAHTSVLRLSTNAFDRVELTLTGAGNLPPVAQPQAVTMESDGSLVIRVTATDPEGDPITAYALLSAPTQGTLSAGDAPGEFVYRPTLGFNGMDRFYFAASDGGLDGPSAAVTIAVGTVPPSPVALDGQITLVSATADGQPANGSSYSSRQALSDDGRFLAFTSDASNLVAGDTNGVWDAFLLDRRFGTISRVSVPSGGGQSSSPSVEAVISGDGRYVAFLSAGCGLASYGCGQPTGVFVHDTVTKQTTSVTSPAGGPPNGPSSWISLSRTGRYVAIASDASNLVTSGPAGIVTTDIFLVDRDADGNGVFDECCGRTSTVLANLEGGSPSASRGYSPWISADGRRIGFSRSTGQLALFDRAARYAWTVHRPDGTLLRGSAPSLSDDGSLLAFASVDALVPEDRNGTQDAFVAHIPSAVGSVANIYGRVSVGSDGAEGNSSATEPVISGDGRFVAFVSSATNLAPGASGGSNIFVHDRLRLTTTFVSPAPDTGPAGSPRSSPAINSDGKAVSFNTRAARCTGTTCYFDVFVVGPYDRAPRVTGVSPAEGPTLGGTAVTISGSDFRAGATVTFGAAAATSVTVLNSTTITAAVPAHPEGAVGVTVRNSDGLSGTRLSAFTFKKTAATLTLQGLTQSYNGSPRSVTVVTDPPGLAAVTVTYNGSPTAPTAVGTYDVVATLDHPDYTGTATGVLTIVAPTPRQLTVALAGAGQGTVTSDLGDIACPGDCEETYFADIVVTLSASAAAGSVFGGWSGDADCSDGRVTTTTSVVCVATFGRLPQVNHWFSNGPEGGQVHDIAVHPGVPGRVFATTGTGVYRSLNGGVSWSLVRADGFGQFTALAVGRANPLVIYALGGPAGLSRSADGGNTWSDGDLPGSGARDIVVDPGSDSILYAATSDGVAKSTDAGATWVTIGLQTTELYTLAFAPDGALYAGSRGGAVFRSADRGATWSGPGTGLPGSLIQAIAVASDATQTVYAGTGQGLFRSSDAGVSWTPAFTRTADSAVGRAVIFGIAIDSADPNRLYLSMGGWYDTARTSDAGATWELFPGRGATPGALALGDSATLYAAARTGVKIAATDTMAWRDSTTGLQGAGIAALVVHPTDPMRAIAATDTGFLYTTVNGGATWTRLSGWQAQPIPIYTLAVAPDDAAVFYIGTDDFIYKTTDGGQSFIEVSGGLPSQPGIRAIVVDAQHTSTLYAATTGYGVWKSADGGASWSPTGPGAGLGVEALALGGTTAPLLLAGSDTGVHATTDGGASWSQLLSGIPIHSLAIDPTDVNVLYAGGFDGLFKSVDGGTTWAHDQMLPGGARAIVIDARQPTDLYAVTNWGYVYSSPDRGESWWALYEGLEGAEITHLGLRQSMLYAGSRNTGVFAGRLGPAVHVLVHGGGHVVLGATGSRCDTPGGDNCVARFSEPTDVTLTPTPHAGYVFDGWTGAPECSSAPFRVANVVLCRATFVPAPTTHPLVVAIDGGGKGLVTSTPAGISCPGTCSAEFLAGTAVTLAASPDSASVFAGWSGACTGSASCVVTLDAARNVIATFRSNGRDLIVTATSEPPTAAVPGTSFSVTDTTRNDGSVATVTSTTRYYLYGASNALLSGTRSVAALAGGAESTGTVTVTIPAALEAGEYRLVACADDTKKNSETNEANNCRSSERTIAVQLPDLVTSSVAGPPQAAPGAAITLTDTAQNVGPVAAAASATRYYLSADAAWDAADVLLTGSRSIATLAPGQESAGSRSVTVPSTTALGTYRLLACADDLKKVRELWESNNCAASAATLLVGVPDLVTTTVGATSAAAVPGGKLTVSDTVRNDGNVVAGASTTRYYLSVDAIKDGTDLLLTGTRSVVSLTPGATSSGSKAVTLPSSTPLGTYRVMACADDLSKVSELSNENNCLAGPSVLVGWPDLVVTEVSEPPAEATAGGKFVVSETVRNDGNVAAGASTTAYYLSLDTTKGAGDIQLTGVRSVSGLGAGALSKGSVTVTVPAGTPAGTYQVLGCADSSLKVAESDETNNCRASAGSMTVR